MYLDYHIYKTALMSSLAVKKKSLFYLYCGKEPKAVVKAVWLFILTVLIIVNSTIFTLYHAHATQQFSSLDQ